MAKAPPQRNKQKWLAEALPRHERLSAAAASLVENLLKKNEIEYLSITARTKNIDGALEKIQRKEYDNPREQLTDLSGVRVVTYLEEQAVQIATVIKSLFEVDEANSHDRTADLGEDKMGYRSTHFVCSLGKERGSLPEYDGIGKLKFEIQVRTVLQHAWAELAHDRSFKFGVALPSKIQRKLNLYSGMLELVDGAFDEIAKEIDQYKLSLAHKSVKQISETEINSISIAKLVLELSSELGIEIRDNANSDLVKELARFGMNTLGDIELLVTSDFKKAYKASVPSSTSYGLLRSLMMYADLDRYFGLGPTFSLMRQDTILLLKSKYPPKKVEEWLKKSGIEVQALQSTEAGRLKHGETNS